MKGNEFKSKFLWIAFILIAPLFARDIPQSPLPPDAFGKAMAAGPLNTVLNINNISIWVRRDGFFPWTIGAAGTAAEYPKGTGGLIFAEGMLWGAKVSDGGSVRVRVNGATYASGMKAGKVLYDDAGAVIGSDVESARHIWRVRSDYATADLSADAATFFVKSQSAVTPGDLSSIYDQYEYDWNNWPADEGAPFKDVDENGVYDPVVDIPGYPGASQTIWLVANDLPDADGNNVSKGSYGSPPIGIEMQLSMWAYDFATTNPLGNILFKQTRLIYTGLPDTPADAVMDTVYFTQWSDPDLGNYSDDFVGCDTLLSLGYVYNANTLDDIFNGTYGIPVPAGGYDFLQGPIINDGAGGLDTLGMTSFGYFGAGSSITDPPLGTYQGSLEWFNLMEGFHPYPAYPVQDPWVSPDGDTTVFALAGDPVAGTGWIDGVSLPPGDRRLLLNTGPFTMALGDTQDVVLALIGALGGDNLNSVSLLKEYDVFAQLAYDNDFDLWAPPGKPAVKAVGGNERVSLYWGNDTTAVRKTEQVTARGMVFEGYNVYQLPATTSSSADGFLIGTYDVVNGLKTVLETAPGPEIGILLDVVGQEGTDRGILRSLRLEKDYLRNRPMSNDIPYYYGISAYSVWDSTADEPGAVQPPFNHLESGMTVVTVFAQTEPYGERFAVSAGSDITVAHPGGGSDGVIQVTSLDPSLFTGDEYMIDFYTVVDTTSIDTVKDVSGADSVYNYNTAESLLWELVLDGNILREDQEILSSTDENHMVPTTIDGFQVKVSGPPLTLADWDWEEGAEVSPLYPDYTSGRWLSGNDWGAAGLFGGFGMAGVFWFGTLGNEGVAASEYHKVELRFTHMLTYDDTSGDGAYTYGETYTFDTAAGQKAFMYETWGPGNYLGFYDIPFQVWDVEDADNPRQLNVVIRDREANLQWDIMDGTIYNYTWIMAGDYDATGTAWDGSTAGAAGNDFMDVLAGAGSGIVPAYYALWGVNRGSRPFLAQDGTLIGTPNYVITELDTFTFVPPAVDKKSAYADVDVDKINVFPNPYYGFHILESSRATKWMRFNHLPSEAVIRIFNLGGTMVSVIRKNDASQYADWNLKNQSGFPVASGIYIAYIELPESGKTKILKLALVQEDQILNRY